MSRSIIYRNLKLYRLAMNLLYKGQYAARFNRVCELIRGADGSVLELCFGDVFIAEYCRRHAKRWIGLDVSEPFVSNAVRMGFDARKQDLLDPGAFPACDVCIMMGSLYHFKAQFPGLFRRIKAASSRFILSEPVRNWTHANRSLRFLARMLTRTDTREETFRFDEASLIHALGELKRDEAFDYRVVTVARDMIVEVIWLN